jgi:SAM-dependent methyltransferase
MTGTSNIKEHWQRVYSTKSEQEVSWYQHSPSPSRQLLGLVGATRDSAIIDVGGGASLLIDTLAQEGFRDLSVLDVSDAALKRARERLGSKSADVLWIAADITKWTPSRFYDVWHDRAAFHFFTNSSERVAYVQRLREALRPGGHAIIATFALDGPDKCSGLPVQRYDPAGLKEVLGDDFSLMHSRRHDHMTPAKMLQRFQFSVFRRTQT